MLSPAPDAADAVPLVPFAKESHRLYLQFVSALENALGQSIEFHQCGALEVYFGTRCKAERDARISELRRLGITAELKSLSEANRAEPLLNPAAQDAVWIPDEAYVRSEEHTSELQ